MLFVKALTPSGACCDEYLLTIRKLIGASVTRLIIKQMLVVINRVANALFASCKKVATRCKRAPET